MALLRRRPLLACCALLGNLLSANFALALWAPVPLEVLVDEAHLIVFGKVAKVQDGKFAIAGKAQDVAVVEVTGILKSLPHVGKPKEVHIAQPAKGGLAVSTDLTYSAGQEGIWLLVKDPDRDVYLVSHPFQFQPAGDKMKLATLIAAREKLPAGKPVDGIAARAEVVTTKPANSPAIHEVRCSVKNVTDKPIIVCDYVGGRPLTVDWTGPDGEKLKSTHYEWLALAFVGPVKEENFVTLPAGAVRFIGPRSKANGVYFQPNTRPASRDLNTAAAGKHTVTIGFTNAETGKDFKLMGVWTGTAAANPVMFTIE
jgi:hypothetical protein